jgi:hypothetical protein
METVNETNAVRARRRPWNKGKLIGPKPPLQPKHRRHPAFAPPRGTHPTHSRLMMLDDDALRP